MTNNVRLCGRWHHLTARRRPLLRAARAKRRLTTRIKLSAVAQVFHDACLAELDALKPSNVHRLSNGHRMSVADFERSAAAAAPSIGRIPCSKPVDCYPQRYPKETVFRLRPLKLLSILVGAVEL